MYSVHDRRLVAKKASECHIGALKSACWIDLVSPTEEEIKAVQEAFMFFVPGIAEIDDIEVSRRLYAEKKAHYLTAYMFIADDTNFRPASVRFVLFNRTLITIRYSDIDCLSDIKKIALHGERFYHQQVLVAILKAVVYQLADILEQIGLNIDIQNKFTLYQKQDGVPRNDFRVDLQNIGRNGDLTAKAREGLISIRRLATYIIQEHPRFGVDLKKQLIILSKDIDGLNDHTFFLSNQTNFLLEATLGMIDIEQNVSMRVFSVASMIFLPPTLVASIYGMNFVYIPCLSLKHGYIIAICLMLLSAWVPYRYFKSKGWFRAL